MHRFEGATMRDAIAKVKAELGDQAVIISTRQVRKGLLGTVVEISAAIDEIDESAGIESLNGPSMGGPSRMAAGYAKHTDYLPAPHAPSAPVVGPQEVDRLRSEMRSLRAMVRSTSTEHKATTELRAEVAELKKLLTTLAPATAAPAAALGAYRSPLVAGAIVRPQRSIGPAPATVPAPRSTPLVRASTSSLVMLVGPTGAGKTTTIAKLAATAALVEGKRVRLVTLDNYRVGGVDQIRTFADLIGVPLVILDTPAELAELIATDEESFDLTLVDTAGTSPRDLKNINQLAGELPSLPGLEVHLCIPATAAAGQIDELAQRFAPVEPARLLFTKLDEVTNAPELARAPGRLGLPLTWVTTGQAVPEDLEQPTQARVLELAAHGLATSTQTRVA